MNDIINEIIKPYIWRGKLWCQEGWGPKDRVLDYTDSIRQEHLILVEPSSILIENGQRLSENLGVHTLSGLRNLSRETEIAQKDYHYEISFPGEKYENFETLLETLKEFTTVKVILEPIGCPNPIRLVSDGTEITIEEGEWRAIFNSTFPRSGWILGDKNV